MWVLCLNDMRHPKSEHLTPVARAETAEALVAWVAGQAVEPYRDGPWHKAFAAGGPLEWYNPPLWAPESPQMVDVGTLEDWLAQARQAWERKALALPEIFAGAGVEGPSA